MSGTAPAAVADPSRDHAIPGLELCMRRLADSLVYGHDASVFVGRGVDYVQSRRFVDGDPVAAIDWRLTARTGRYYVKEYEATKGMPVYLVVDTSASMAVSSLPLSKFALALQVAGAVALAALRRFSPVGLIDAGERDAHVPLTVQTGRVLSWFQSHARPRYDEETSLPERLSLLAGMPRRRCLIVVVSDCHHPQAASAITRAGQRHDLVVIQPQDPAERVPLRSGLYHGREAERDRPLLGRGGRALHDPRPLQRRLRRARIDHLLLPTDGPVAGPLTHFFAARGGIMRRTL